MARFDDRVAIVTGAAGGLGSATARRLAREGATVVLTDVMEAAGEGLADEIGGRFIRHDVSDAEQWRRVAEATLDAAGRIDILVNAAGIEGDLTQGGLATSYEDYRKVLSINLDGTFLGCLAVMPHMMKQRAGAVITAVNSAVPSGSVGRPTTWPT